MKIREQMEHVPCNLCGADDYTVIYEAKYDPETEQDLVEKFKSSGDELLIDQVVKCKRCGLIYTNPRLNQDLIFKGYSMGEDPTFVSQAKGREITFARSLNYIEKHAKKGKILDIGTAGGTFLHVAKQRGWEVYGLEPNTWLCDWGKKHYGIDISHKSLFDQQYPDNFFDVVTLYDVLEHMGDPKRTLQECNRILKPGGILVVNYPDIGSWLSRLMRRRWIFLLSVHIYYFTRPTIKAMLAKTGFKVEVVKPHIQTLSLGYLIYRMEAYSKLLHKTSKPVVKALRMDNLQVPYWLGQTFVLARKP